MHVVLTVLSVLGWILLGLLALVVVLLLLPVRVNVKWTPGAFTAKVWLLLVIPITLYPRREKPTKEEQEAPKEPAPEPPAPEEKAPKKRRFTPDDILGMISTAGAAMRLALKGIWFTGIRVVWTVHEAAPDETAVAYGKLHAYLNGFFAALRNFLHLRFRQTEILADFDDTLSSRRILACNLVSMPIIIVVVGIYALLRLRQENII